MSTNNQEFFDDLDALERMDERAMHPNQVPVHSATRRLIDHLKRRGEYPEEHTLVSRTITRHAPDGHITSGDANLDREFLIVRISKEYFDFIIKHATIINALARIYKYDIQHIFWYNKT